MSILLQPWHILLTSLCGMVNERQQQIIQFQNAQIEALLKKPGKKRLLLDDEQRRLLAVKAHARQSSTQSSVSPERIRRGATIAFREHLRTSDITSPIPQWPMC
ncbi:MAG: hypothetical protein ABGZ23_04325 [Fuerstiella sp.]